MNYNIEYIDNLIKNKAEESLTLEFKSSGSLSFDNKLRGEELKTELSRDISSMANSGGGLIIYGIREKNHVAFQKTHIDGNTITKERIEQIIQNRIKRPIQNVKIHPIRENGEINQTIYIIEIHESEDSPHMAYDGVYYKRNNFNRIQYMEYEVRRDYERVKKSDLTILYPTINSSEGKFHKQGNKETGHFRVWFHVKNTGKIFESEFKQEILIPKEIHNSYYSSPNPIQKYGTHSLPKHEKFSIPNSQTIFPGERLMLCSTYMYINEQHFNQKIHMKLYFSGGTSELEFTIREMFDNQYLREEEISYNIKYQDKKYRVGKGDSHP